MFLDKIISKLVNWYMWPVYVNCLMCLQLVRFLTGHVGITGDYKCEVFCGVMGRVLDLKALPSGFESHSVLAHFYFRLMLFFKGRFCF